MKKQLFSLGFNLVLFTILVYSMIYDNDYLNNLESSIKWFYWIVGALTLFASILELKQIGAVLDDCMNHKDLTNITRKLKEIKKPKNSIIKFLTGIFFYGMIIIFSLKGFIFLSVWLSIACIFSYTANTGLKKDELKIKIKELNSSGD